MGHKPVQSGVTPDTGVAFPCCGFSRNVSFSHFLVPCVSFLSFLSAQLDAGGVSRAAGSEVELRFVDADGDEVSVPLPDACADVVVRGRPVRAFGWYAGMKHYPGWWWSATMCDLVGYESLLERDRLLLADFDYDVKAIASQPFGLTGRDGDVLRGHVPDYLLCCRDGSVVVVDAKPAEFLEDPKVADVLSWTGGLMARRGWRYEVWSGIEPVRLANVRFLGQGRRRTWAERQPAWSGVGSDGNLGAPDHQGAASG